MLMKELKNLNKNPVEGFSAGLVDDANPFEWEICIIGPPDSPYEGGFFNATMKFPPTYPNHPPTLRINSEFWHPNVYNDGPRKGEVCISILHEPGEDRYGYEQASERWLPIHSVQRAGWTFTPELSAPRPPAGLASCARSVLMPSCALPLTGRVDPHLSHLDAVGAKHRLSSQHRRRQAATRGRGRVQEALRTHRSHVHRRMSARWRGPHTCGASTCSATIGSARRPMDG